jgi:hypothetical protein
MTQATATQTAPAPRLYTQAEMDTALSLQERRMRVEFEDTVRDFFAEKAAEFQSVASVPF